MQFVQYAFVSIMVLNLLRLKARTKFLKLKSFSYLYFDEFMEGLVNTFYDNAQLLLNEVWSNYVSPEIFFNAVFDFSSSETG